MGDEGIRIQFTDLKKSYGDVRALEGLSLDVRGGEIYGLIGPDGAGKTTAMRIACGLMLADAGSARVMGFDCARESQSLKEHLGYMPQRFSLYPDLTVAENLRFFADLFEVGGAERKRSQARLMEFSGLAPFLSRRAGELSGGMKQKLALCCTLIHTPDVLILDEPTTGVDVISRREFWEILRDLGSKGMALLVSTPYMDEAMLFDRVAMMHRGRAIAAGTPPEVAGRFDRKLLELSGKAIKEAHRCIAEAGLADVEVLRFGDRLHVVFDTDEDESAVRGCISGLAVSAGRVAPDIEDAFVRLVTRARRGGER